MSLENSRYANPGSNKVSLAGSSVPCSPRVETAIATSEQIAASYARLTSQDHYQHNADTQLAIAHANALKEEVDKHAARFSTVVSTTVTNTRRLLDLIREASSDSTKAAVDTIWQELNELYAAVNDAKAVLPVFLEKQRNNVSLYHAATMTEMIKDTQHELDTQHKKVSCPL